MLLGSIDECLHCGNKTINIYIYIYRPLLGPPSLRNPTGGGPARPAGPPGPAPPSDRRPGTPARDNETPHFLRQVGNTRPDAEHTGARARAPTCRGAAGGEEVRGGEYQVSPPGPPGDPPAGRSTGPPQPHGVPESAPPHPRAGAPHRPTRGPLGTGGGPGSPPLPRRPTTDPGTRPSLVPPDPGAHMFYRFALRAAAVAAKYSAPSAISGRAQATPSS